MLASISGQGAAGTYLGGATFALVGKTPCSLTGYAGLDVTTGSTVTHAVRGTINGPQTSGTPTTTIEVAPNKTASVDFSWSETPKGSNATCPRITKLTVTAPGLHMSTTKALSQSGVAPGGAQPSELCSTPGVGYVYASS